MRTGFAEATLFDINQSGKFGTHFLFNSAIFSASALAFFLSFS
jgi:hypothetical protein